MPKLQYYCGVCESLASDDLDHCPLLLALQDNTPGRCRFHFESFWPKLTGFQEVVSSARASVPAGFCPFRTFEKKIQAYHQRSAEMERPSGWSGEFPACFG